jgi:hypothetical protein
MENLQAPDNIRTLPMEFGKTPVARLTKFYIKILASKMGTTPVVTYAKLGAVFKRLLVHTPEIQLGVLLMAHFNYNPDQKGSEFMAKVLRERLYPIELFASNINSYKTYLIFQKHVEIDDLDSLPDIINKYIDRLS